jgi:hypothetical protein
MLIDDLQKTTVSNILLKFLYGRLQQVLSGNCDFQPCCSDMNSVLRKTIHEFFFVSAKPYTDFVGILYEDFH